MTEIQVWPFLVSRNQFLDYRTVVAPDFLCEAKSTSLLARVAEGDLTDENSAYYREIFGSKCGDFTIIYRVVEALAKELNSENEGVLRDSFGREIYLIEGLLLKDIDSPSTFSKENLDLIHEQVVTIYREFWGWLSPQSAISLDYCQNLKIGEGLSLKLKKISPYIVKNNNNNLIQENTTKFIQRENSSQNKEKSSIVKSNTIKTNSQRFDLSGEVHQCFYLDDSRIILYIRPFSITPHDHKVVDFDFHNKHEKDIIKGELLKRSIETLCLSINSNILLTSNRSLVGKDNAVFNSLCVRPCFLALFKFGNNEETIIYEGGSELIAISKDSNWIVSISNRNSLNPELFDVKKKIKEPLDGGHSKTITCLASSFYDNIFASADESGFLRLWSFDTLDSIGGLQVFDFAPIGAMVFSLSEKLLVCSSDKGDIKIIEYKDNWVTNDSMKSLGTHRSERGISQKVNALALSNNGVMLASAGDDGSIRLWNLTNHQNTDGILLSEHNKSVLCISFSPDGKYLASGSKDKTLRIWQIS